jgi:F-type H+-transporting ATPase subunit epsilon
MLRLEIVTPEKRVLDAEVDAVTVPTATGEAGILPHHAPLISALKPGLLTYTVKGVSQRLAITGGFIEVSSDRVAVLADSAETAEDIDLEAARSDRENAERTLAASSAASAEEADAAREQLESANVRYQLAAGR